MKNWRTEKAMYMITEVNKKHREEYPVLMTGNEVSAWIKTKNEVNGYIEGVGGDRSYTCFATLMRY